MDDPGPREREGERERGNKVPRGCEGGEGAGVLFYSFIFNGAHFAFQAESNKKQQPVDGLANA